MSSLKFYHAIGSPPSRGCLMLIRKIELDAEVKLVNLAAGEQNDPEFLKLNPQHQVPVLVDGDFVLTESRAILAYLINKFKPGSGLYPNDPKARALVDQRLYYDATVVFESNAQIIVSSLFITFCHSSETEISLLAKRSVRRPKENTGWEQREVGKHSPSIRWIPFKFRMVCRQRNHNSRLLNLGDNVDGQG